MNSLSPSAEESWEEITKIAPRNKMLNRHIRNYCLSNSQTFQDGHGNGNFDGNWESMEMKGRLRGPRR